MNRSRLARIAAVLLAPVLTTLHAGCSGDAASSAAEGPRSLQVDFRGGADASSERIVRLGDAVVRVACPTYGTKTGPYLALSAKTGADDARARVWFRTRRSGSSESYRFEQRHFDRSYGEWDLLGAESGPVAGALIYDGASGNRVILGFEGSGGRADRHCDLHGIATLETDVAPLPASSRPKPVERGFIPAPIGLAPGQGELDRCGVGAGGYDVWIKDVSCPEVRRTLTRLIPTYGHDPNRGKEGIGRLEGGWECWSRLERRHGPIHNVCVRGEQLIMFYFA